MARTRKSRKNKKKNRTSIAEIIIFSLSFIILSLLITNNCFTIIRLDNENKDLNVKLALSKNDYLEKKEQKEKLNTDLLELDKLNDHITETREEIFKLASELEKKILNGETEYKIAYLTFDDGPYYSTNKVLDILKQYGVKATFFTIGLDKDTCYDNKNYSCYDTYKKIVDNGHTIANHTYSHLIKSGLYSNYSSFIEQVKKQEELVKDRTGIKTNILRFPGGSGTANSWLGNDFSSVKTWLSDNGYGWVDWTASDGDGGYLNSYSTAWNNFTSTINDGIEVVLFHDYSGISISMLPDAIEYLENNNYILLPLFHDSVKINK